MNNVTTRGDFDWSSYIRVPATPEQIETYTLQKGDVLFTNTNSVELVGKSVLFEGHKETVVYSNHFTRLRTKPEVLVPAYLSYWLQRRWSEGHFAEICNRWIGQAGINQKKLLSLKMPVPSLEEQREIVEALNKGMTEVDKARAATEAQLEAINSLPAALLRQAFSGQLANQKGNSSASDVRGFIGSYIVHHLHNRPTFGVTQLMKVLYMAQVYFGLNLAYTFGRGQYGPFDKAVYDLEAQAEQNGWFEAHEERKPRYEVLEDISAQLGEAEKVLGDKKSSFIKFLSEVSGMDTKMLEAVATLYAAWNDLLLDGQTPTDKEILAEVLERWPGKAESFQYTKLSTYLKYLKALNYIPTGTGQSTRLNHAA